MVDLPTRANQSSTSGPIISGALVSTFMQWRTSQSVSVASAFDIHFGIHTQVVASHSTELITTDATANQKRTDAKRCRR